MENGAFSVSDKKAAAPGGGGGGGGNGNVGVGGSCGLGGVVHASAESFRSENVMMGHHIHRDGFDGGGTGGDVGPTCGANKKNIYTYGGDAPQTSTTIPPFTGGGGGGAVVMRISQPLHCSNITPLPFKCQGMSTALGFPFTWTQWKELERQAMVFKYMMASVPVPPDLLLAISTDTYAAGHTTPQSGGLGFCSGGKNRDLEPGRCKRTDGKKWRCSKEVAPNQKYCERHLHRGRPRSRKPVEDHTLLTNTNTTTNNTKKTRLQPPPLQSPSMLLASTAPSSSSSSQLLESSPDKHNNNFSISPFKEPHRNLDWEMVAMGGAEEQWQQLMDTNTRLAYESSVYRDDSTIFQPMNLFDSKDLNGIRQCNMYLNPELGSLDKEFINAWSNGNIANNTDTPSLDLSMAMAAGDILDSQMGILDSDAVNCVDEQHNRCSSNSSWRSPVSWVPFASGGPLAEVLKPNHHSSSYISNGDSISPAGTTVSSPSGVLQKTALFSQSDGSSVCNSPTLAAAELVAPFQWPS